MLANLDASEQDQMRRLLTTCIASLTEPARTGDVTPPDRPPGPGHVAQAATAW
jgi:hypothetical protein